LILLKCFLTFAKYQPNVSYKNVSYKNVSYKNVSYKKRVPYRN